MVTRQRSEAIIVFFKVTANHHSKQKFSKAGQENELNCNKDMHFHSFENHANDFKHRFLFCSQRGVLLAGMHM